MTSRKSLFLVAALAVAVLGGCATGYRPNSPEAIVKERANLRWQALLKGDFDTAYKMSNPAYRSLSSLDRFRGRFGSAVSWVDAKVVKVECEPEKCQVTLEVGARPVVRARLEEPIATAVKETWILEDGQWWYYQRL
jgi:hypothetical protein